ncbi:monooxygenase [Burkholderia humptydooensis]|uniref:Monooxygenase n=2 Tax=Burkholderia humptydooensis TaxID=430531 RepID=A0A7U4PB54_9BURK|nr:MULTISPECIES: hypothetical protein [Burkholderia]ALX46327.1 monooxygenase [Burkholderia humptydooensis]EIP84647.1 putative monooxygenase [Burkholderia humptydooensis MSMB43]QPS47831.1 monooxygenase [Burkholderia humptydooensis]
MRDKHERIDYEQGRLKLADMLGGGVDLRELPLDQPLPESLLLAIDSVHRRRGRVAIFVGYARQRLTLRELIIRGCRRCSTKQWRRERANGRTMHRAPRSTVRCSAISRDQISIEQITIWYMLRRALQSRLLPAATPVVPTLFQKFAT